MSNSIAVSTRIECFDAEDFICPDKITFDAVAVEEISNKYKSLFENNSNIYTLCVEDKVEFQLLKEEESGNLSSFDWSSAGWRYNNITISKYGNIWMHFKQKHSEEKMEIKLADGNIKIINDNEVI